MTIQNRYEFVYLFDVEMGNPNGDPDAGNLPRLDPETNKGYVTDVCLKRKIRNFIDMTQGNKEPNRIYIREAAVLNNINLEAHKAMKIDTKDQKKPQKEKLDEATQWMCKNFFDVRTFGAVMSTGVNCGQVRGPVQLTFARSNDAIVPQEVTITRMAVTTEKEAQAQGGDNRTMGRKFIVPYGLYRAEGFISPHFAKHTGFDDDDLELLWNALINMFDHDHSAARGKMNARGLYIFKHESHLGNAPSHKLFDLIEVSRDGGTEGPSRSFSDYQVQINDAGIPKGVSLENKI